MATGLRFVQSYSRATDLTVLACPVSVHGIPGACQVVAALLHGVCTLHTSSKESDGAWVEGSFSVDNNGVHKVLCWCMMSGV